MTKCVGVCRRLQEGGRGGWVRTPSKNETDGDSRLACLVSYERCGGGRWTGRDLKLGIKSESICVCGGVQEEKF